MAASLAALAAPGAASAHARLLHTSPVDGSVAAQSPLGVLVDFDDDVRPGPGNEVVRNGGGRVLTERPRVGGGGRTLVILFRRALADGDYSVRWSIVSDDGHLQSGVLAFGVGLGRAPPHSVLDAAGDRADGGQRARALGLPRRRSRRGRARAVRARRVVPGRRSGGTARAAALRLRRARRRRRGRRSAPRRPRDARRDGARSRVRRRARRRDARRRRDDGPACAPARGDRRALPRAGARPLRDTRSIRVSRA